MFKKSFLYLTIVSTLIFSGCFIAGEVVDENGVGVAGITVTLSGDQSRTTTTNSRGFYYFGDLKNWDIIFAGSYTITPSKFGYSFTPPSTNVTVTLQTHGDFENCPWPVGDVDFEAVAPVHLADVEDGRIFQRDSEGQYDLLVEGTYSSNPDGIEARVVMDGSAEEVVPWTVIDDDPSGGTFSGTLEDIPQGGWYNIQVRASDNPSFTDAGTSKFGVGVLVVCAGQSHLDLWFEAYEAALEEWESYGEPPSDELTRMFRHEQVLQQGPEWTGWQPVTGVGARIFANKLQEALRVPVGLLDYSVGGSAIWQRNTVDVVALGIQDFLAAMGWWLPDDSGVAPGEDNYAVLQAGLNSIDNRVEAIVWIQGDSDAGNGESTAGYREGQTELFSMMRSDTGIADLPIFTSLLPRMGELQITLGELTITSPPNSDEDRQNIRTAQEQYCDEDPNTYLGCTTIDLPLVDGVHHTPVGQKLQAERVAQAVLHVLLNSGKYTYHRGPQLASYEIVDSSTLDVHITHSGGNDFTPTSDMKGFEVFIGESVEVPTWAYRYDANTIRLKISDDTSGVTGIRYLYGVNPGDADLQSYADTYVHDNSALQLPLEGGVLPGSPADNLPPHITRLTDFGSRPDWSIDGERILFLNGPVGDLFEIDINTREITCLTDHYQNFGYMRALYLANGDILLCGPKFKDTSSDDPEEGRFDGVLWVLEKPFDQPAVLIDEPCWEGPTVSRSTMKIAWTKSDVNWNDFSTLNGYSEIWMGEIEYIDEVPTLVKKVQLLNRQDSGLFFFETQNFRPPNDDELIFSLYAFQNGEVMGLDLNTGEIRNYSNSNFYEEVEGIFPDGQFTAVERDQRLAAIPEIIDIWKLSLDGNSDFKRLTFFSNYEGFGASNPVVRDDARYMAFQMKDASAEIHGAGLGLFLFDLEAFETGD